MSLRGAETLTVTGACVNADAASWQFTGPLRPTSLLNSLGKLQDSIQPHAVGGAVCAKVA